MNNGFSQNPNFEKCVLAGWLAEFSSLTEFVTFSKVAFTALAAVCPLLRACESHTPNSAEESRV